MTPIDPKSESKAEDYEAAWEKEIVARVKRLDEGKSDTLDWREAHEVIRRRLWEKRSS